MDYNERYKERIFRITLNERIAPKTWRMELSGDTQDFFAPGQFVNIRIEGKFLRRPISVCNYADGSLTLLYDVVGEGTAALASYEAGKELSLLTGLGNGFDTDIPAKNPVLIGGGIGCAPLLALALKLRAEGKMPTVVLGFNTAADIVLRNRLEREGFRVVVSTADGSEGVRGFVTDALRLEVADADYFFACGPLPMLRALCGLEIPGQLSLDQRMACGFGVCMCCSLETNSGPRRICADGPVFSKDDLKGRI